MTSNSWSVVKFSEVYEAPYGVFHPLSPFSVTVRRTVYPSLQHFFLAERFSAQDAATAVGSSESLPSSPIDAARADPTVTTLGVAPSGPLSSLPTTTESADEKLAVEQRALAVSAQLTKDCTLPQLTRLVRSAEAAGAECADWMVKKIDVMLLGMYLRCSQHESLRQLLLGTEARHIVFHSAEDRFWGDGGNGTGKNWLGVIIMAVRARLADEEKKSKKLGGKRREETVGSKRQSLRRRA